METFAGLGTRMRHVLELLDGDVARVYADLGLAQVSDEGAIADAIANGSQ